MAKIIDRMLKLAFSFLILLVFVPAAFVIGVVFRFIQFAFLIGWNIL